MKKLQDEYEKNKEYGDKLSRIKLDEKQRMVMNDYLVYEGGRFRQPGSQYFVKKDLSTSMTSNRSSRRGSRRGSRRSSRKASRIGSRRGSRKSIHGSLRNSISRSSMNRSNVSHHSERSLQGSFPKTRGRLAKKPKTVLEKLHVEKIKSFSKTGSYFKPALTKKRRKSRSSSKKKFRLRGFNLMKKLPMRK